jgi:hypothetical protein
VKSPRARAADAGRHIYHTGKPCLRGHNEGRYTRTARCVRCTIDAAERTRRQYAARLDAAKAAT